MSAHPLQATTEKVTLTACCCRCKDLFTVWGERRGRKVYIEPQSCIRSADNTTFVTTSNRVSLNQPLYHHCGGLLKFYPNYKFKC
jgi:hypothetical protein